MPNSLFPLVEPQPDLTEAQKLEFCRGCTEDFYNNKNPLGVERCWSLSTAKLVFKKFVHIDQRPPWNQEAVKQLHCHRKPRHISVHPETTK